jgi:hypothetical protein
MITNISEETATFTFMAKDFHLAAEECRFTWTTDSMGRNP